MGTMDQLAAILKNTGLETTFDSGKPAFEEEKERFFVDSWNRTDGELHLKDGYNCKLCRNKGVIWEAVQRPDGHWTTVSNFCKCDEVRRSIRRMKKSGLKDIIKDYTFEKYEATDPWQVVVKEAAMNYAENPDGWFFLGGQSGAGKTHLCTAICRHFLLSGHSVVYMLWRDDMAKLKGLAMEPDKRQAMIDRFKKAEILYIDDLFKTGKNKDGVVERPTAADVTTAFEIINFRYNNPHLMTIISSEWSEDELLDIDEATGGRIFERAQTFSIEKKRGRNYRTRKAVTI